jgi:hypothetical protein
MSNNFAHLGGLNAYEILGVETTATTEEIEAAYRAAIKRQHSDTGGVTRLAQLVNDARDALVKHRASYDVWLRDAPRRIADSAPGTGSAASASDSSRPTAGPEGASDDDVWDPWETFGYPPPPRGQSAPRSQPGTTTNPDHGAEERPSEPERLTKGWVVAIVIGGMSVLSLVSLAIAVALGVFRELPNTSSPANPTVMKQGQVLVEPGTRIALDEEGTSFTPSGDHASMVGTDAGLLFGPGTSYVALTQPAPERYDTCSALNYPEATGKPIPWNRLTVGSKLCVRTTSLETTKSLITVADRTGRSATLQISTWND